MSETELHQSTEAQQIGRRLFLNNCASCHGMRARGGYGFPNLTDGEWQWGGDYDIDQATIRGGRIAAMPAWGPALGDAGIADMAQYVLSLSGAPHDAAAAARAAPQFQTLLRRVPWSADGKGNPALGAPDLTNDIWLYGADADTIAFTIRNGRNGMMPNFATTLGEDRIAIVAAYVSGRGSVATPMTRRGRLADRSSHAADATTRRLPVSRRSICTSVARRSSRAPSKAASSASGCIRAGRC